MPVNPVATVKVAETEAGMVPADVDKSEVAIVFRLSGAPPKVVLVTLTVMVQVLSVEASGRAKKLPPVKISLLSSGNAVSAPPQLFTAAGLVAKVNPAGKLSVKLIALNGLSVRLRKVSVMVDSPP